MTTIQKAVIPVAGLGTRLRPLTLHQPKGMVGIVDQPIIHYIIDELAAAGIRQIILITSPGQAQFKKYIHYLNQSPEWKKLGIQFDFVLQKKLRGSADALMQAEKFVRKDPFLVYFGDDLLDAKVSSTKQFVRYYAKTKSPILVLEKVPRHLIGKCGIVKARKKSGDLYEISTIVEKPKLAEAPSDMGAIGRYVLTPEIFDFIRKAKNVFPNKKEIAVADALSLYLKEGGKAYGWLFQGTHFDAGSKQGLLQAQIYYGLKHPELKKELRKFIKKLI